jgi:hypothetical protein
MQIRDRVDAKSENLVCPQVLALELVLPLFFGPRAAEGWVLRAAIQGRLRALSSAIGSRQTCTCVLENVLRRSATRGRLFGNASLGLKGQMLLTKHSDKQERRQHLNENPIEGDLHQTVNPARRGFDE